MNLECDGAQRIPNALSEDELRALDELARRHGGTGAGIRITHDETLSQILTSDGAQWTRSQNQGLETMPSLCERSFSISGRE